MTTEFTPRVYQIMRKDIPDMNPGKAIAQANHAGNDMTEFMYTTASGIENEAWHDWKQTRTFGTCITLEMTQQEYFGILEATNTLLTTDIGHNAGFVTNTVHDPTYPIRNHYGYVYTVPMDTCWWVFVYDENSPILPLLRQFKLHQ